jgi:hypothetical protein
MQGFDEHVNLLQYLSKILVTQDTVYAIAKS